MNSDISQATNETSSNENRVKTGSFISPTGASHTLTATCTVSAATPSASSTQRTNGTGSQGRLFSYGDAQRYRLGVNHHLIPVNAARCPTHSFHRDGAMRVDGNYGSTLHYEPNSYGEWKQQPEFAEPPLSLEGAADHWNHREDDDYYTQPGLLFRRMNAEQKTALFGNTARAISGAPREIQIRHIGNCVKADMEYGKGVADALGISLSELG